MSNNKEPKVSIIIPAYNASKYLKEAIDSALKQTYKNIEIIVVNDGSKDKGKTRKIAESYGNKIKYFEKENGGVSSALNLGISKMEGEYFSWLSHDDRYYPNKIEEQIKYLSKMNYEDNVILYSDYDLMDKNSTVYAKSVKNHEELIKKPEYALLRGSVNGITLLIPKKAFDECGMFDEKLRCVQDYDLWKKMQGKYIFTHQEGILATTRLHKEQQGNTSPNMLDEGEPFWINLIKDTPIERKKELEGTEYNFYYEMLKFLKTTPYNKTADFVKKEIEKIEEKAKNDIKNIRVTVIIPFYNRINCVCDAIDSVINQTHKNTEIILINDGSTDDISLIIEKTKKHNNISIIDATENKGPANARNIGMEKATGEYIAFLDSDDSFKENKIEVQLLKMYLTGTLFSHTSYVRRGLGEDTFINIGERCNGFIIPQIIAGCGIATPTLMINKKLFSSDKFRYNTSIRIGEDVCLYLSTLKDIFVLGINEPLTIVNVSEDTCAYNYEKQLEGLSNIISFVTGNSKLAKYNKEVSILFREYIRVYEEKTEYELRKAIEEKKCKSEIKEKSPNYLPTRIKDYISLYKNDRPLLKEVVLYKLRNHPRILKILKKCVKIAKRLFKKK